MTMIRHYTSASPTDASAAFATKPPMRMQVTVTDAEGVSTLVAEVVAPFDAFGAFQPGGGYWERWVRARMAAGKPAGGACLQRADLPRLWDGPVGSTWRLDPDWLRRRQESLQW